MGPCVVTLIAHPGTLTASAIAAARAIVGAGSETVMLRDATAADIVFNPVPGSDQRQTRTAIAEALGHTADVVVQPVAGRRKRLFLADMDSTMIGQECIDELADFAGLKAHIAAITERAMRGEIAFEPALRERVGLLRNLPVSVVDAVIAERITLTPGARTLIATMRAHGAYTCMVSGGITLFTDRIAAMIGFDESHGNRLVIDGQAFAGTVEEPIFGQSGKRDILVALRDRLRLSPLATMATGDGANDIAMIEEAGLGIAFHAKPKVAAAAAAQIDHGDLTALLYVQGYRNDEFVGA